MPSFLTLLTLMLASSAASMIQDRVHGYGGVRRARLLNYLSMRLVSTEGLVRIVLLTMWCHLTPQLYLH
jgi:hypothetical protein